MVWVVAAIVVVALGVAAVAATGGFGEMPPDPGRDVFVPTLPETTLSAQDLERLRFGVTLRGYAIGQVDQVLDRLAQELADRDAELTRLRTPADARSGADGPAPETLRGLA